MTPAIPAHHIDFARKVAQLARDYDLRRFSLTVTPGLDDPWDFDVETSWHQDTGDFAISSRVTICASVATPKEFDQRKFRCGACKEYVLLPQLGKSGKGRTLWCEKCRSAGKGESRA